LKVLELIFVYIGAFLLVASLFPTRVLCNQKHHATMAWRALGLMIIVFLGCYAVYGTILLRNGSNARNLFISAILLGGGIFVYSVVKLTQTSIERITLMVDEERHRSLHDDLTDLPNREFLSNEIDQAIERAQQINQPFAILLVDLRQFKEINTTLGHFYGDFLIQKVAIRLAETVRNSDTLARFGGDKFAVLMPDTDEKQAVAVSQKITAAMKTPFEVEANRLVVETSIGIVLFPDHAKQSDLLLQNADIAMYEAQKNHVDYSLFDLNQDPSKLDKMLLLSEIRGAIKNEELVLYFQPQVSVVNGKLCGAEALVRWDHPQRGLIMPDDFIDIIERTGLSNALMGFVLNKALQHQSEWQQAGLNINMSVNLSVKNLHDYEFPSVAKELIKKWQINPSRLTLEITESGLMVDPGRVTKVVSALKSTGVNLSIDDFGTGYSSLAYLRKFPAREIKIDKSFVFDMLVNEDSAVIVKSTIDMAHNIGRLVVAEGVENNDTRVLLRRLGCDFMQGFLFSKALPPEEFLKWHDQYDRERSEPAKA
jgi:diguanylate cyclase (GGDEF)-like protein